MGVGKTFVPDRQTAVKLLRERHDEEVAAEFERLVAEGKKIEAVHWLRDHGFGPSR